MKFNGLKTAMLLGAMSGMLLLLGQAFGGSNGLVIGFGLAVLMNFASYFSPRRSRFPCTRLSR